MPQRTHKSRTTFCSATSPAIVSWLAGNLTPILTSRRMRCLGSPIALLWRFRELPEGLASYSPLPGLLSAAASLLLIYSVVAFSVLLRSLHCFFFVEIILPFAPSCGPCPLYFIYSSIFLCVVAFSSLLPFCCNHFTLCPFLWSLPLCFIYRSIPPGLLGVAASLLVSCSVVAFSVLLRSLHCCLFVAIMLPFAPSCGPCPLYFI